MPVLGRGYLPDWIDENAGLGENCMVYDGVGRVCCRLPLVPAPEGCIRLGLPSEPSWPPKPREFGPEPGIWEPHAPEHGRPLHPYREFAQATDRPHPHLYHGVETGSGEEPKRRSYALVGALLGAGLGVAYGLAAEMVESERSKTALLGAVMLGAFGGAAGYAYEREAE